MPKARIQWASQVNIPSKWPVVVQKRCEECPKGTIICKMEDIKERFEKEIKKRSSTLDGWVSFASKNEKYQIYILET